MQQYRIEQETWQLGEGRGMRGDPLTIHDHIQFKQRPQNKKDTKTYVMRVSSSEDILRIVQSLRILPQPYLYFDLTILSVIPLTTGQTQRAQKLYKFFARSYAMHLGTAFLKLLACFVSMRRGDSMQRKETKTRWHTVQAVARNEGQRTKPNSRIEVRLLGEWWSG